MVSLEGRLGIRMKDNRLVIQFGAPMSIESSLHSKWIYSLEGRLGIRMKDTTDLQTSLIIQSEIQ